VNVNDRVKDETIKVTEKLRENNIPCQVDLMNRNLVKQLQYADSLGIPYAVIIGPEEIKKKIVKFRDMKKRKEVGMKLEDVIRKLKSI
jgi:histidyl-tRNA synthetase